jgi:hypothetical protein
MQNDIKLFILILCLVSFIIKNSSGQSSGKFEFERIEDNSFLIEEAYNQDPGVIQHISSFQYTTSHNWIYTFTDEWPVPGKKHQLSATIPILNNGETGLGDVTLNYRYQAIYMTRFAFSPRFSLLFPTGSLKKSIGAGVPGYQLSLPFSFLLSRKIVTHYNLGVTFTPGAKNTDGTNYNITTYNYGLSFILLLNKNFNLMLEALGYSTLTKAEDINTKIANLFLINPGFRYAINFKSGLQIVPGLAAPIGFGSSGETTSLFVYLSFEHPLWKPK